MDINLFEDNLKEKLLLIKKFCGNPRCIGSITPSSSHLMESILNNIDWEKIKTVAEFGAGTGVFTTQIIQRMTNSSKLFIFEIEPELRERLQSKIDFLIYSDAAKLPQILKTEGIEYVDLVISSLPYALLPKEKTTSILSGVINSLHPEGTFLAYQYSLHMKDPFEKIFGNVQTRFVPLNIPPAFVYECRGLLKLKP